MVEGNVWMYKQWNLKSTSKHAANGNDISSIAETIISVSHQLWFFNALNYSKTAWYGDLKREHVPSYSVFGSYC